MRRFNTAEFPSRLVKVNEELNNIIDDMRFNREYPIDQPDSVIMYTVGNLENAARNIALVCNYFEALTSLRR